MSALAITAVAARSPEGYTWLNAGWDNLFGGWPYPVTLTETAFWNLMSATCQIGGRWLIQDALHRAEGRVINLPRHGVGQ